MRPLLLVLGLGAAYAAGSVLSYHLFGASDIGVAYYPPAGVSAAALVLLARRDWPWAVLGFVGAELLVDTAQGYEAWRALGFALGNSLEPLVGASLFLAWNPHVDLRRRRDLARFSLTMLVAGPAVGALVGSLFLVRSEGYLSDAFHWWIGDALAVLTVGASVIALARRHAWQDLRSPTEAVLFLGGAAAVSSVLFWHWELPFVFLAGPLLLIAAFRYGLTGVATAGLLVATIANVATATGSGPFAALDDLSPQEQLGMTQLFLAVVVLSSWFFAAEIHERLVATDQRRVEHTARARAELVTDVVTALERDVNLIGRARAVADLLVPELADYATIEYRPEGHWEVLALTHRDPHLLPVLHELRVSHRLADDRPGSVNRVATTERPGRVDQIDDGVRASFAPDERTRQLLEALAPTSHTTVPLRMGDVPGVLLLGRSGPGRSGFTEADHRLIEDIGWRTGLALENARLYEETRRVARELQRALMADSLAEVAGCACAGRYEPGAHDLEVGGDWYETIDLGDGRVGLAVGDVVGRGLKAAATMGRLRTALAAVADGGADPGAVLDQLDRFARRVRGADCASCCYAVLDLRRGLLHHASAGHPPLLIRRADGTTEYLEDGRSGLLGLGDGPRSTGTAVIEPGDTVILYSDGLVERRDEHLDLGLGRLADVVAAADPDSLDDLCDRVMRRMAPRDGLSDDAVVLAVVAGASPQESHRLTFPADPGQLARVRQVLRTWLAATGMAQEAAELAVLAVNEACSNAIEHAYHDGQTGDVDLGLHADDGHLVVTVRDRGAWRPDHGIPGRGRGAMIMEELSEDVDLVTDGRGTSVRLTFSRS